jgi:alpha-1,3-fucosyltransferase
MIILSVNFFTRFIVCLNCNFQNLFVADKDLHSLLQNKTKTAAWFVSNCNAHSDRDKLTSHLQKYIDVDVYGKCGPLKCPSGDSTKNCDEMLDTTYKFYLSFENSLCIDYVTEKLYRAMTNNIIPIVFNGANMKYFVPPKSVIDANDFETVEDLAVHLKFLSDNLEEYEKYFWWKEHYEVAVGDEVAFCDLCKKVNEMNSKHKRQVYEDISQWWINSCNERKIKF